MNKLWVPALCVLVGCAAGAIIPVVTAQWPDNPQAVCSKRACAVRPRETDVRAA